LKNFPTTSTDIAFVVVSCDKYSVLWTPFFKCFNKYWPDCPYDKFLVSNHGLCHENNVITIKIGDDQSYSDNLILALKQIDYKWIIVWLDDVFIAETVETARLVRILQYVKSKNAGYLKLAADMPMAYFPDHDEEVGQLPKGIKYRAAMGCAFYKKETLLKLLTPSSSAWDLDRSRICDSLEEPFYALTPASSKKPPIKYSHLLIKGRWLNKSVKFLRKEGLSSILSSRAILGPIDTVYLNLYLLRLYLYRVLKIYWR